jgi:DNA-binding winged helix-turn-helix (wHTH) protein/pimeloyl-ACP methyl ester carboxylesterase
MSQSAQVLYEFGPFRLDPAQELLVEGTKNVPLTQKAFRTLLVLIESRGQIVSKEKLLQKVWPDTFVEEATLAQTVFTLRKVLKDDGGISHYIETVPKRGYRFVARVRETASKALGTGAEEHHAGTLARQEIRYCTTADGVRLAYATSGSGSPLVKASNWLTHLDFEWGSPIWRHWYAELSRHHRFVRYDERGNGMSQRNVDNVSFDTWIGDLETVVDVAGLDRFPLLGISRGGSIAIAYAVKHPERVTHLVLYGAFAVGLKHVGTHEEIEARRALTSLTRLGWGLNNPAFCRTFTCRFIPEATPEHEQWFDELQRVSTSPESAARLMEADDNIDVRPLLSQVKTPTIVIHCDRDHAVPAEGGRILAAKIPGARYVSLPGANHLMLEEEPAWSLFLEELGLFLSW